VNLRLGALQVPYICLSTADIYVECLSVGGPAAEVFKRCGSAFRAEGWRALEELGAVGGGELAKLGGAVPGGLWLGARFSRRRLMWPLRVA